MTREQIHAKLYRMVDELTHMPDSLWQRAFPTIRITFRSATDPTDAITLVVGVEQPRETDG